MQLGFHISIAKGFDWTLKEAKRLGCEVVQIFVRNPRSWRRKTWSDSDRRSFKRLSGSMPVFAHLTYLPNLAKIDEDERHMKGFIHEVELCGELGLKSIVIHCGSRHDKAKGIEMVSNAINYVTSRYEIDVLMENSAGQGNSIGKTLDELFRIFEQVEKKRERLFVSRYCSSVCFWLRYPCSQSMESPNRRNRSSFWPRQNWPFSPK